MAFPWIMAALAAAQQMQKAKQQNEGTQVNAATMKYSPWTGLAGQASSNETANQANGANYVGAASDVIGSNMAQEQADKKYENQQDFQNRYLGILENQNKNKLPGAERSQAVQPDRYSNQNDDRGIQAFLRSKGY